MTLFTFAGLIEAGAFSGDPEDVMPEINRAYQAWLRTQKGEPISDGFPTIESLASSAAMQHQRMPGTTCLQALREGGAGTPEAPINDSKGCGGVMRVAPVGLVGAWSLQETYQVGEQAAALTHGHPAGQVAAGAMAALVRCIQGGRNLFGALLEVQVLLDNNGVGPEVPKALSAALERSSAPDPNPVTNVAALGKGWVAEEALAIGFYAAYQGQSFADVVRVAASHDGDSDSTASIAGQLYGAQWGLDSIPHAWIRRLDILAPLLEVFGEDEAVSYFPYEIDYQNFPSYNSGN